MRLFFAGMMHETNSFSPIPTGWRSFADSFYERPSRSPEPQQALERISTYIGMSAMICLAREDGHEVVMGPAAFAPPSAPATLEAWRRLHDEIVEDLRAAGRIDAVLVVLHGAQLAEGCDDCEGELLRSIREHVGARTPIGVLLDLHGHVSDAMLECATAIVACLEYPHTDFDERAQLLYRLTLACARGAPPPKMHLRRVPMLAMHHTTREPMRFLTERARSAQGQGGIRAVSLLHGFPWADTADAGAAVLVVADRDAPQAAQLCETLAHEFFEQRGELASRLLPPQKALDVALEPGAATPVVVADFSDNPGGGAACDSTFLLEQLLRRKAERAGVAILWDPQAVRFAMDAGVGATLPLRLGGKAGPMSGKPLDVVATVRAIDDDVRQGGFFERSGTPAGAAMLQIEGVTVVVSGRRQQCVSPEAFTQFGLDPSSFAVLIVKSSQHFFAGFAPIAARVLYANAPGSLSYEFRTLPYRRVRRPIWPLDEMPARSVAHGA